MRSPRTSFVVGEVAWRKRLPNIEDWCGYLPGFLDHVGTVEEHRIADHAVVAQGLIAGAWAVAVEIAVGELHLNRRQADRWSRRLRLELQRDALVRLDVNGEAIRPHLRADLLAQKGQRRAPELHDDFGVAAGQ